MIPTGFHETLGSQSSETVFQSNFLVIPESKIPNILICVKFLGTLCQRSRSKHFFLTFSLYHFSNFLTLRHEINMINFICCENEYSIVYFLQDCTNNFCNMNEKIGQLIHICHMIRNPNRFLQSLQNSQCEGQRSHKRPRLFTIIPSSY